MKNDFEELLMKILNGNSILVNTDEMAKYLESDKNKEIESLVFMPDGNGYVIMNNESEQKGS